MLLACLILSALALPAQNGGNGRMPTIFTLGWDNDFVFQTDYYYTIGMSLHLWRGVLRYSPLNLLLIPHRENQTAFYGLSFQQDMFTPVNKFAFSAQPGDRLYASYWLIG